MKIRKTIALVLVSLFVIILSISGCKAGTTSKEQENTPEENVGKEVQSEDTQKKTENAGEEKIEGFKEAPMLAQLVKEGKLPPVKERLPEEPLVYVEGTEVPVDNLPKLEIGKYGGTLRIVNPGSPGGGEWWAISREPLLNQPGFGTPGEKPVGNVLKDFDMSEDGKVFTFYMRKGLKWSDGHPVTTEDVRFAYEDVLLNEELTPVFPTWLANPDGTPCELEIVDEYTFRIKFKEPYALFPYTLSLHWQTWDSGPLLQPSHYMKKFHIKYTPLEELKPLLEENGLGENEWYRLYSLYSWGGGALEKTRIGCPTLAPYMLVDMPSAQVAILRRNPYYWKVDAAGNQLPYIDEIRADTVTTVDMLPMKIMGGEVDLARQAVSITEVALYKENEKKGGYRVIPLKFHCPIPITFNYSNPDPVWREIVWDTRFRQALNLAINREEIIDAVYHGFASPSKITPSEYDPEKANQLLDSMGLDKRDSEGWRLRPDGKRMELLIETSAPATDFIPMIELLVEYWKNIGIYTTMKQVESSLLSSRVQANETQVIVSSWFDLPVAQGNPYMLEWVFLNDRYKVSDGFHKWYTRFGKEGIEPPDSLKPVFELYRKIRASESFEEIGTYMDEWEKAMHDSLFLIVPVEDVMIPLIVSNRIKNVPEKGYQIMANFAGEVLFYGE
ncbi:peptide/nickel transport system substrate-binding protein [Caldicoprobacter guelmensis]|uniref:ABC transporter substrate-binding protein n=1 Tax=Caldicoprobacter guelmensis TaxID=1170224 RepID=UPI00195BFCB6|nr:ABC transporter substrate-binding protein [Caldicoprobacter guelmensis]MBM7582480.1 peptide/nickel transport system substrate-binding protein [Caldicoprobacter guelmensis]